MQLANYPLRPKLSLDNLMKIRTNRVEMNKIRRAASPKSSQTQPTKKTRSQVLSKAAKMSTEEQLALIKQLEDSMEEELEEPNERDSPEFLAYVRTLKEDK